MAFIDRTRIRLRVKRTPRSQYDPASESLNQRRRAKRQPLALSTPPSGCCGGPATLARQRPQQREFPVIADVAKMLHFQRSLPVLRAEATQLSYFGDNPNSGFSKRPASNWRPQSFVAKYEGRERRLDVAEYLRIARELGADPYKLLRDAENNAP